MKVSMTEPNFSTFDLRIRNGKGRNKKKLLWPIGATEMNIGFPSDNARWNSDYFHWLWKTSLNVQIPVKKKKNQKNKKPAVK